MSWYSRSDTVTALNGRFSDAPSLLAQNAVLPGHIDGVLLDTGASSMQFDQADRGFSLSKDGPLDMRMDGNRYLFSEADDREPDNFYRFKKFSVTLHHSIGKIWVLFEYMETYFQNVHTSNCLWPSKDVSQFLGLVGQMSRLWTFLKNLIG